MSNEPTMHVPEANVVVPETSMVQPEWIRFPPFPEVPEGVTIVPFHKFKERGIQMDPGPGGGEVDGLGIPTVELLHAHGADQCKTNTTRKEKKERADRKAVPIKKKEWWEVWEGSDLKGSGPYNQNESASERFNIAGEDFRRSLPWPVQATGVQNLWDQFRLYCGLLGNTPVWRKNDPAAQDAADEDDGDDDDDESSSGDAAPTQSETISAMERESGLQVQPRIPYSKAEETPVKVDNDDQVRDLVTLAIRKREQKLQSFLADPEKMMKKFLSSYMQEQGLIWSDRNLKYIPLVVQYFITFVIRNRVLPEHQPALQRTLDLIKLAKKELPLTSEIGKALPGDFSNACEALWGRKSAGFDVVVKTDDSQADRGPQDDGEDRQAKRQKVESMDEKEAAFVAAAKAELISPEIIDPRKEAITDNIDDGDVDMGAIPSAEPNGWGTANGEGWGTPNGDSWGTPAASGDWGSGDVSNWGVANDTSGWEVRIPSLVSLLGPTTLPLTHTTGICEWSLRRIQSVTRPPTTYQRSPESLYPEGEPDPKGVECELEKSLAKMVLEPWIGWDEGSQGPEVELSKPRILPKSRGAVASPSDASPLAPGTPKPHDMMTDCITVLVPLSVVDYLGVGMGLGATWVEITRQERPAGAPPLKKKKGKKKPVEKYWYMEQLMSILPSYYVP